MDTKLESKVTVEATGFFDGETIKTGNTHIGNWWAGDICEEIKFNRAIQESGIAKGEYKITITVERVGDL